MEYKRKHTPEIGKEPVVTYSNAELHDMVRRLDEIGIGDLPIISRMTMIAIDKLLNGPVN